MGKIFLSLGLIAVLMGCRADDFSSLKGEEFSLNSANIILGFDKNENKFYGKAVNNYFGIYTLDKNNIKLELQGSTMMMGPIEEMDDEVKYFNELKDVTTYTIKNDVLILKGNNVELNFTKNNK